MIRRSVAIIVRLESRGTVISFRIQGEVVRVEMVVSDENGMTWTLGFILLSE